jgi:hypothetical protein
MQRNPLIVAMSGQLNVDVGVIINGTYADVEGCHFDPERGVVVLDLDEEALEQALTKAGMRNA